MGGQTDSLEVVLNWYLNTNLKFQLECLVQDPMGDGQLPGNLHGLSIRTQYFFQVGRSDPIVTFGAAFIPEPIVLI